MNKDVHDGRREVPVSEQSSTVVMFRALVMLVCLIAIPLAALFSSSLPAVVKAAREGRWPTLAELKGPATPPQSALTEPPPFVASSTSAPAPQGVAAATAGDFKRQSEPAGAPALLPRFPGTGADRPPSEVVSAGFETPIDPTKPSERAVMPPERPTGYTKAVESPGTLGQNPATASPQQPGTTDPFSSVLDRIRQMGATYYLLESWGDQKREFRFYCRMAIGGNSQYTRSFWSIDTDPCRAMGQVLEQVEAWRSGRP